MQTTMNLLDRALEMKSVQEWHAKLGLSRNTLHTAKIREHLSPAIAGALADEMGEDAKEWIVIAALESERASSCKEKMLQKFMRITSL